MASRVLENRRAYALYEVLDRVEAGMALSGSEVKSLRLGRVNFRGSYVAFMRERPFVIGLHISRYPYSSERDYDPERPRGLLLNRGEIKRLEGLTWQKGMTLIPLKIYFKNNLAKLEIGICRGKKKRDRREELKRRAIERDIEVAIRGKM